MKIFSEDGKKAPVCITGMHRSGTSMVTRLLGMTGIFLGPSSDLQKGGKDNPEGFWENLRFQRLNKAILAEAGGAWDFPPHFTEEWEAEERYDSLREEAERIIRFFDNCEPWGWKDPRNSLTLPFWKRLLPDLKVVVCLRSPIEVAQSLKKRNNISRQLALNLWLDYNRRILETTTREERIVTHYDVYFHNPKGELARILDFIGVSASDASIHQACETISDTLRHSWTGLQGLVKAGVPEEVSLLYEELCAEAGPVYRELSGSLSGGGDATIATDADEAAGKDGERAEGSGVGAPGVVLSSERLNRYFKDIQMASFSFARESERVIKDKDASIACLEDRILSLESVINEYHERLQQASDVIKVMQTALPLFEDVAKRLKEADLSDSLSVKTGELCYSFGLYGEAKYFFEKALTINPDNSDAMNNLGVLICRNGDYKEAEKLFLKALEKDPGNVEAKRNLALLNSDGLGRSHDRNAKPPLTTEKESDPISLAADSPGVHARIKALLSYCHSKGFEGISQSDLFRQSVNGFNFDGQVRTQVHILPGHDFFLRLCVDRSGGSILDLGCGTGNLGVFLKKHKNPEPEYFGLDSDEKRIRTLKDRFGLRGAKWNILEFFPELAGRFDTIILNQVIEHLELEEVKLLFKLCKDYKVRNILLSTPSIEHLPLLAYYNVIPESLTYANHKTFWTIEMLNSLLENSFPDAKNIEVGEFNESFPFIQRAKTYYHLYAEIIL